MNILQDVSEYNRLNSEAFKLKRKIEQEFINKVAPYIRYKHVNLSIFNGDYYIKKVFIQRNNLFIILTIDDWYTDTSTVHEFLIPLSILNSTDETLFKWVEDNIVIE